MLCARCGHQNPEDARFCSSCGAPLGAAENEETTLTLSAVEAADRGGRARALPRRAPARASACSSCATARTPGRRTASRPTVDRDRPPSRLRRSSSTTSRSRAGTSSSTRDDDGYTLRDVGSLNGTYVNRKRVDEARLHHGDEVQIGRYRLTFVLGGERGDALSMAKRTHSSIGDVLNQLRDEFPDITISKIRFLESQGLVEPERTPSGYRKFYPADVERLRFILRQQTRALPAVEGHQGTARRDRPRAAVSPCATADGRAAASARSIPQPSTRCSRRPGAPRRAREARSASAHVRDDDGPDDLAVAGERREPDPRRARRAPRA